MSRLIADIKRDAACLSSPECFCRPAQRACLLAAGLLLARRSVVLLRDCNNASEMQAGYRPEKRQRKHNKKLEAHFIAHTIKVSFGYFLKSEKFWECHSQLFHAGRVSAPWL